MAKKKDTTPKAVDNGTGWDVDLGAAGVFVLSYEQAETKEQAIEFAKKVHTERKELKQEDA